MPDVASSTARLFACLRASLRASFSAFLSVLSLRVSDADSSNMGAGEGAFETDVEGAIVAGREVGVEYPDTLGEGVGATPRISASASADACNILLDARFRERDLRNIVRNLSVRISSQRVHEGFKMLRAYAFQ